MSPAGTPRRNPATEMPVFFHWRAGPGRGELRAPVTEQPRDFPGLHWGGYPNEGLGIRKPLFYFLKT